MLLVVASMPHSLWGQSLEHVKEFYVIDGNVQFLPGGNVVVTEEDGKKSYYALRGSIFV